MHYARSQASNPTSRHLSLKVAPCMTCRSHLTPWSLCSPFTRGRWGYVAKPKKGFVSGLIPKMGEASPDRVRVYVCLMSASGLRAADKNGLSDPYCKILYNNQKLQSSVCWETLDPVWEQDFQFKLAEAALPSSPITFQLFDKEFLTDRPLGRAELNIKEMDLKPSEPHDLILNLDTQGLLHVRVTWETITSPGPPKYIGDVCGDVTMYTAPQKSMPFTQVERFMPWLWMRWKMTSVSITFKAQAVQGLNSGGQVDPYAVFVLAAAKNWERRTRTLYNTDNPVWDADFSPIQCTIGQVCPLPRGVPATRISMCDL